MNKKTSDCGSCISLLTRESLERVGFGDLTLSDDRTFHGLRCAPVEGSLVLLVSRSADIVARCSAGEELVAQFKMFNHGSGVALWMFGWISAVPSNNVRKVAEAFSERHVTGDLLGVGSEWDLFEVDIADAWMGHNGHVFDLPLEHVNSAFSSDE